MRNLLQQALTSLLEFLRDFPEPTRAEVDSFLASLNELFHPKVDAPTVAPVEAPKADEPKAEAEKGAN